MSAFNSLFTQSFRHLSNLTEEGVSDDGKGYIQPTRRNLGVVSIVLLREAIAPVVFRNEEATLTRISAGGLERIRATPNKTKFVERGLGLQILRALDAGGRFAQNRTVVQGDPGDAFDLNTAVFGDSAMSGKRVLPIKAAVNYSDAISLQPASLSEVTTMHQASNEEGTQFDPVAKGTSVHLFDRSVVRPGTFFLQVLTIRGRSLPKEGFDHLLLSLGVAGAYGGQTSVSGTNLRTHIVGIYGGPFEQAINSPYEGVKALESAGVDLTEVGLEDALSTLGQAFAAHYPIVVSAEEAEAYRSDLVKRFIDEDPTLVEQYAQAKDAYKDYFNAYFGSSKPKARAKAFTRQSKGKTDTDEASAEEA